MIFGVVPVSLSRNIGRMWSPSTFEYALESTKVVLSPMQRIETFGITHFDFVLVSELMDTVDQVRIRDGRIDAERPTLITPDSIHRLLLEGFGDKAEQFAQFFSGQSEAMALLRYGFQIKKSNVHETLLHEPVGHVVARLEGQLLDSQRPLVALIHGVDDAWEVCLLKFTLDLILKSASGNLDDFRRKGLI
ncbi:MAG: hypothetical protein SNJ52_02970 [Verrucomicrobiia bacterium]